MERRENRGKKIEKTRKKKNERKDFEKKNVIGKQRRSKCDVEGVRKEVNNLDTTNMITKFLFVVLCHN